MYYPFSPNKTIFYNI